LRCLRARGYIWVGNRRSSRVCYVFGGSGWARLVVDLRPTFRPTRLVVVDGCQRCPFTKRCQHVCPAASVSWTYPASSSKSAVTITRFTANTSRPTIDRARRVAAPQRVAVLRGQANRVRRLLHPPPEQPWMHDPAVCVAEHEMARARRTVGVRNSAADFRSRPSMRRLRISIAFEESGTDRVSPSLGWRTVGRSV